jgi:hypothetical protein
MSLTQSCTVNMMKALDRPRNTKAFLKHFITIILDLC